MSECPTFIPNSTSNDLQNIIIRILDQFPDTQDFDILLAFILGHTLNDYLRVGYRGRGGLLDTYLQRYSDNALVKSLNKSLNKTHFKGIKLSQSSSVFKLGLYTVLLKRHGKDLDLWFWSRSFDELFYHSVSVTDISSYLERLKSRSKFSESDIEIIEMNIYFILGPQKGANTENTTRFIKAYERGRLYDFFGWEWFPLTTITSNPSLLSKIIVQHEQRYVYMRRQEEIESRINLKDFDNEHICPPAKLLAYHLLNEPFDQKLLEESIEYFRDCSSEEKKGAFSILYKLLNPLELT